MRYFSRLVKATFRHGKDAEVEMFPLGEGNGVGIPRIYWTCGWGRRLAFAGKAMYVLNKRYSEMSPERPRWSLPVPAIAEKTGLSQWFISKGTAELRRANLVEVDYDEIGLTVDDNRRPNIYTPRPLYDPKELEKKWKELENRYGKEKTARARKCAELVYEDSNVKAVEMFIDAEEEYGREKVEKAYKIIELKNPDNPRRCVGYFINTIKSLK